MYDLYFATVNQEGLCQFHNCLSQGELSVANKAE
jgi:hypothetical protein